jgi:hypothetical protein
MPIRINLLNEALAEEELRRRDPVKRAIFIGVFLVVLSLVWFSTIWLDYKILQQSKNKVEIEIDTRTNEFSQCQFDLRRITDSQRRLNGLAQLNSNRFLQGNLMNALQQIYVPNVQLLHVKLEQSYINKEGTTDSTNAYGSFIPGHPGSSTEHITLTLDGKDSSPNLDQMNHYKEALTKLDYFKSNLDPIEGVKQSNVPTPQSAPNGKPFVLFTLECRFTDKNR